jgi:hypothetical protein
MAAGTDDAIRGAASYRDGRWLNVRTTKTIAASAIAAVTRSHIRVVGPRDAAFGGDACEGCRATPAARPDLGSVFARFRFLAKAIDDAQVKRAKRHA